MDLSKEKLDEISRLAELLISPSDIAIFIEADQKDFIYEISNQKSEIYKAFRKGYLITLISNRESLFKNAETDADSNLEFTRILEEYESIIQSDLNRI